MKSFLMEYKNSSSDIVNKMAAYGLLRQETNQGINSHGIDIISQEYSGL